MEDGADGGSKGAGLVGGGSGSGGEEGGRGRRKLVLIGESVYSPLVSTHLLPSRQILYLLIIDYMVSRRCDSTV